MTITEFLLIHTTPEININFSQRINILYTILNINKWDYIFLYDYKNK